MNTTNEIVAAGVFPDGTPIQGVTFLREQNDVANVTTHQLLLALKVLTGAATNETEMTVKCRFANDAHAIANQILARARRPSMLVADFSGKRDSGND